jgi:hypothetical protein
VAPLLPDIDAALRIDTTKAGFTPAFLLGERAGVKPAVA